MFVSEHSIEPKTTFFLHLLFENLFVKLYSCLVANEELLVAKWNQVEILWLCFGLHVCDVVQACLQMLLEIAFRELMLEEEKLFKTVAQIIKFTIALNGQVASGSPW